MVDICCDELCNIDLTINSTKSVCLRIGPRWRSECCNINTSSGSVLWTLETNYLGVTLLAGKTLKFNMEKCKSNFYKSFNAIYSQLGRINNPIVTLNLTSSIALPCLPYAAEAMPINNALIRSLEHPWTRVFMKTFTTFDSNTIIQCQFHTGFMPVEHLLRLRKVNFIKSLATSKNCIVQAVYTHAAMQELLSIANHYQVDLAVLERPSYFKSFLNEKMASIVTALEQQFAV